MRSATLRLGRPLLRGPLAEIWWVVLIRAVAAVAFGAATLGWPRQTTLVLVALFGVYALFDGAVSLLLSVRGRDSRRWPMMAVSAVSVAAGAFAFAQPRTLALVLVSFLGAWILLRGMAELFGAASLSRQAPASGRRERRRRWSIVANSVISALFGVGLIVAPKLGALALMWGVGAWAILHGLLMIPFALELRRAPADASP